jgi:hypothetical protein
MAASMTEDAGKFSPGRPAGALARNAKVRPPPFFAEPLAP